MKCPFRKIIYHRQADYDKKTSRDEEGFAECYGKECPYYDSGLCRRALWKEGAK